MPTKSSTFSPAAAAIVFGLLGGTLPALAEYDYGLYGVRTRLGATSIRIATDGTRGCKARPTKAMLPVW